MTDMLAAREVVALRQEVENERGTIEALERRCAEWRAGVEAANRISQRERERAERAEAALRGFLAVFWPTAEEGHTGFVDRLGMEFYRETGIWPPFKSEPMEIARPDVEREAASKAWRAWRAWLDAKRDAAAAAALAVLPAAPQPKETP